MQCHKTFFIKKICDKLFWYYLKVDCIELDIYMVELVQLGLILYPEVQDTI